MSKIMTHLSIEAEIWELAKLKYPNQLSGLIEDYLKTLLYSEFSEIPTQDIAQEQKQTNENIANLKLKLQNLNIQQKKQQEQVQQTAKQKQEETIKEKKCLNCGNFIHGKIFKFLKGSVCRTCFYAASKEKIIEWDGF